MSDIDKDIERVKELQSTIYEGGDYIYLNKNDKQALENVLSELETYKKIAEKLAFKVNDLDNGVFCNLTLPKDWNCKKYKDCDECVIDWARKEVEKDDN